jgi:hypothetical protein
MTIYDGDKNKGFLSIFVFGSFAVVALPCLALGAGRGSASSGGFHASAGTFHASSGGFRVSRPGPRTQLHGFHRRGFFDGDSGVIPIEQPQAEAIIQPQQPVHKGRYVQPRWVDGGYGVQVSEPGYWIDTEK